MFRFYLILILFGMFVSAPPAFGASAAATLKGTAQDSPIDGRAVFEETDKGLKVTVQVLNAPPGKHGFHIHEKGDCGDKGNAAGGHFNPDGAPHGYLPKDGFSKAHAGDFGNIEIGPDGTGTLETVFPELTLKEGGHAVAGKTVILHEKEDNFGQPTGNAGPRIACGIILEEPGEGVSPHPGLPPLRLTKPIGS